MESLKTEIRLQTSQLNAICQLKYLYTSLLFCSTVISCGCAFLRAALLLAVRLLLQRGLCQLVNRLFTTSRLRLPLRKRLRQCSLALLLGKLLDRLLLGGLLGLFGLLLLVLLLLIRLTLLLINLSLVLHLRHSNCLLLSLFCGSRC